MPDGWSLHFETAHTVQTDSQALKSMWSTTIKPVLVLSPSNFTHILCFLLSDPETVDLHMTRICHHILETCVVMLAQQQSGSAVLAWRMRKNNENKLLTGLNWNSQNLNLLKCQNCQ